MSRRVVVIGAGIVGQSIAWRCREKGMEVTVVDRGSPETEGCSWGNAGLLVPSHVVPLAAPGMVELGLRLMFDPESPFGLTVPASAELMRWANLFRGCCTEINVRRHARLLWDLLLESVDAHAELASLVGVPQTLHRKGLLMVSQMESKLDHEAQALSEAQAWGLGVRQLSPKEVKRVNPGLDIECAGGVLAEQDCHNTPNEVMSRLPGYLAARGVQFLWGTEVTGFDTNGGRLTGILTDKGRVGGEEFVVAAGSWSGLLAKELKANLPLQPGRGQSLTIPHHFEAETPMLLMEARLAITPMTSGLRIGGTMELGAWDLAGSESRFNGMKKNARRFLRAIGEEHLAQAKPWAGLRPCSPDGVPYIGRLSNWENVSLATGHAMLGWSLGPVAGRQIADLLADGKRPHPALRPERF